MAGVPVDMRTDDYILSCTGPDLDESVEATKALSQYLPVLENLDTALSGKVDKVDGKGLSTNDYTTAEKTKLAGIEAEANNYTHPATHPASMITGLPTSLPANGGTADKVSNKLTVGSKSFDGSVAVALTAADVPYVAGESVQSTLESLVNSIVTFGSAVAYNVGTAEGDIPALGAGGKLPMTLIDAGGGETIDVTIQRLSAGYLELNMDMQYALGEITSIKSDLGDIGTILDSINGEVV